MTRLIARVFAVVATSDCATVIAESLSELGPGDAEEGAALDAAPPRSGRRSARRIARATRRAFCTLGLLWVFLAASPAVATTLGMVTPDRWVPHSTLGVLDRVTLRVHWYDSLAALREAASGRDVSARDLRGFAILLRNTESGEYVCDVFVVRMGGALVDNDRTLTFGHEILHCFGLGHD